MSTLTTIGQELSIEHNPELQTLSGLADLQGCCALPDSASLVLLDCDSLLNLHGLEIMTDLDGLNIRSCQNLDDLSGLENLTRVGVVRLVDNDSLVRLADFSRIQAPMSFEWFAGSG